MLIQLDTINKYLSLLINLVFYSMLIYLQVLVVMGQQTFPPIVPSLPPPSRFTDGMLIKTNTTKKNVFAYM